MTSMKRTFYHFSYLRLFNPINSSTIAGYRSPNLLIW
jgi:hypothetical protein